MGLFDLINKISHSKDVSDVTDKDIDVDYGILISISFLLKKYSPKLLLLAYWCSPIVIYIFYWHGQLDALPVCFLVWSIVKLEDGKAKLAGIFLGMALSAKLSMFAAIPFMLSLFFTNMVLMSVFVPLIMLNFLLSIFLNKRANFKLAKLNLYFTILFSVYFFLNDVSQH